MFQRNLTEWPYHTLPHPWNLASSMLFVPHARKECNSMETMRHILKLMKNFLYFRHYSYTYSHYKAGKQEKNK